MVRGGKSVFSFLVIFLLIISSFSVYADEHNATISTTPAPFSSGFNQAASYNWLYEKVSNSSVSDDVQALSNIALLQGGTPRAGPIEALRDKEDAMGCWPRGSCRVKDSALATLALSLAGQDITKEVDWLKKARVAGLSAGEWWVVVKANNNGTCEFSYPGGSKTYNLQDEGLRLPSGAFTRGQYYVSLNDLNPNLKTVLQPTINVACDPSLSNPIITLIFKPNTPANTFFIQRSDSGASAQLTIANACFGGQSSAGPCNYESTAYATWALAEIGVMNADRTLSLDNVGTHIYLESQALNKKNDPVALGLLNHILIKAGSAAPSFISDLVKLQRVDGSWDGNIISTSVATFGLSGSDQSEAVTRGVTYLTSNVDTDGSWDGSIEETSWALIAIHGGQLSRSVISGGNVAVSNNEICGNTIDDDNDGSFDCGEAECLSEPECQCVNNIQDGDETGIDCGGSCSVACVEDQLEEQPPDFEEPEEEFEEEPVEEEGGSAIWWIIILLILIGGGIFFYIKYIKTGKIDLHSLFKKKPKGPTFEEFRRQAEFRPVQQSGKPAQPTSTPARLIQPSRPMTSGKTKSKEEDELERSIREAEKLLKG